MILYFIYFLKFYLSKRERAHEQDGGSEGERESSAGSTLSTEPNGGLYFMTLGS